MSMVDEIAESERATMEAVKAKTRAAIDKATSVEAPSGIFTVWVYESARAAWYPKDFDTLQEAIDWPGKGSVYAITKPVRYEVREVGANPVPFRPVAVQDVPQGTTEIESRQVDWSNPNDIDRDDEARYV